MIVPTPEDYGRAVVNAAGRRGELIAPPEAQPGRKPRGRSKLPGAHVKYEDGSVVFVYLKDLEYVD